MEASIGQDKSVSHSESAPAVAFPVAAGSIRWPKVQEWKHRLAGSDKHREKTYSEKLARHLIRRGISRFAPETNLA